jgi:arginase family enzyme
MANLHFIKAPCHQSKREQGFQFAPDEIKEKYDYEIDPKLFDNSEINLETDEIKLCVGYNLLYNHILEHSKNYPNDKIITIGGDNSISSGTIPAINERYIRRDGKDTFTSDLVILWIDSNADIQDFETSITQNLDEMPCASIMGLCDSHFTKHKLNVWSNQIIYFGINDEEDIGIISNNKMVHFTAKKINQLHQVDPTIICGALKDIIGDKPVHIVLDMKVFHSDIVKSVCRNENNMGNNGLQLEHVENVLTSLKNNIVAMDICEFNPLIGNQNDVKVTNEMIRYILKQTFDITEKSINIFSEDTQFLIYRPMEQEDPETDIGWFILRGIDMKYKEALIESIPDDTIISLDIEDHSFIVTKTTITEQNEKSYYVATTVNDTALFPQEKATMMFELVN